ncbi:hypothetical protein Tco_0344986 [Tanacetum coccineum]
MILGSLKKSKKQSFEDLNPREQDTRRTSGNTTRNDPFPPFLLLEAQTQVIEQYTAWSGMDMKMAKTCYHSHFVPEMTFAETNEVIKEDMPRLIRGTLLSSSISRITKSSGKVNLPTSTSIFLAIPRGYWNDQLANLMLILVGLRVLRDKFAYKEYSMRLMLAPRNGDCGTGSQSDNMVGRPYGFVIHGIKVLKGNEKVTEVIDVENWCVDNSRMLRWIVSLFEWNSSVSSTKYLIQSTFRFRRCLEALELKGGDGGACKLLGDIRSSGDKESLGDDASKQGRIDIGDIDTDAEITLIDETQGRINDIICFIIVALDSSKVTNPLQAKGSRSIQKGIQQVVSEELHCLKQIYNQICKMAISSSSSSSSSDNKVQNCSKQCLESFKTIQKNFDSEREKHNRAKLEIQGYELALESLESRILGHEKNEMAWGEKYEFQNYDLKCREIKINNLKTELKKVVKKRDELKVKIEKWEESSKSLNKLLNSQMNANDKNGLGYGTQMDEMSNKFETDSEISMSIFEVRSSDEEITSANDRFSKADGYHVVPPPITGNFLTPRADISFAGLDEFAIRKKIIESKTTELKTDTSKSKTSETVGNTNEVNIEKPKSVYESVVSTPNINREKVIIEDWNSDDEDDVSEVIPETQTVKTQVDKIGQIYKKEGIGFKKMKACFVCKSTDHLIRDCDFYDKKSPEPKLKNVVNTGQRVVKPVWDNAKRVWLIKLVRDCDFHEKKIAKQVELNKLKGKGTGQGEKRPVWNNVQRLNHQNNFVPKAVLTKTGRFPVNAARQNLSSQATATSTARKVNTARPIVNEIRPRNNFFKSHSPNRRPFNRPTASKANLVKVNGVNTAKGNAVKSDVKGN